MSIRRSLTAMAAVILLAGLVYAAFCPNCGKGVKSQHKFCAGCGAKLSEAKKVSQEEKKDEKKPRDLLFLACLFIGLGVGINYDKTAIGVLIGIGVGFLAAFLYETLIRKKK